MLTIVEKLNVVKSHQVSYPVQTVELANNLGLSVYRVAGWPNDLSGKIMRSSEHGGDAGFAIYVNAGHHLNRRRFTIAHEIAHFILHEDQIGDGIADDALYRSLLSSKQEAEANRLAADILMPWHLLNPLIDSGIDDVKELAERFKVSASAMSIRLGVPFEMSA